MSWKVSLFYFVCSCYFLMLTKWRRKLEADWSNTLPSVQTFKQFKLNGMKTNKLFNKVNCWWRKIRHKQRHGETSSLFEESYLCLARHESEIWDRRIENGSDSENRWTLLMLLLPSFLLTTSWNCSIGYQGCCSSGSESKRYMKQKETN